MDTLRHLLAAYDCAESSGDAEKGTLAWILKILGLEFELGTQPSVFLAHADGILVERLDVSQDIGHVCVGVIDLVHDAGLSEDRFGRRVVVHGDG